MIYSCLEMIKRSDKDRSIHLAPNELLPVVTSSRPTLLELLGKTCFPVYATNKTIKFGPMRSSKKSIASYCSPRY